MNDDTITRARAAVARLREDCERARTGDDGIGIMLVRWEEGDALLALAEAVGRMAVPKSDEWGDRPWWGFYDDGYYPACQVCWEMTECHDRFDTVSHAPDCPALAIDAALAALAALADDADAGGIAQSDPDGGVHHLRNMSDIARDAGEVG